jgi:hypothetical protein
MDAEFKTPAESRSAAGDPALASRSDPWRWQEFLSGFYKDEGRKPRRTKKNGEDGKANRDR